MDQKVSFCPFCQSWLTVHIGLELSFSFLFGSLCFSQSMSFVHLSLSIEQSDRCSPGIAEFAYCYRTLVATNPTTTTHVIRQFEIQLSSVFLQRLLNAVLVQRLEERLLEIGLDEVAVGIELMAVGTYWEKAITAAQVDLLD